MVTIENKYGGGGRGEQGFPIPNLPAIFIFESWNSFEVTS